MSELYSNTISFFADGGPVPDLLTEEEAIKYLRLDLDGLKNPRSTLKYYRDKNYLKATRVGKHNKYLKTELLRFLEALTTRNENIPD